MQEWKMVWGSVKAAYLKKQIDAKVSKITYEIKDSANNAPRRSPVVELFEDNEEL